MRVLLEHIPAHVRWRWVIHPSQVTIPLWGTLSESHLGSILVSSGCFWTFGAPGYNKVVFYVYKFVYSTTSFGNVLHFTNTWINKWNWVCQGRLWTFYKIGSRYKAISSLFFPLFFRGSEGVAQGSWYVWDLAALLIRCKQRICCVRFGRMGWVILRKGNYQVTYQRPCGHPRNLLHTGTIWCILKNWKFSAALMWLFWGGAGSSSGRCSDQAE